MTKRRRQLLYLISAISIGVIGIVCLIIASISAFGSGKKEYYHNIEIKEINTQLESVNGVTYHFVTIDGDIFNNTDNNYKTISVEITFDGIDNKSGQDAEFVSGITLENLNADSKVDVREKILKVGNQRGFVPQSIKSIKLISTDEMIDVPYEETNEASLILFGCALVLIFVSGLILAKWNNGRKIVSNTDKI